MRRRSLPPLALAACLIGGAATNYGALEALVVLLRADPLPEVERVTYLELTPLDESKPEEPAPEEEEEPDPPDVDEPPEPVPEPKPEELAEPIDEPLPEPEPEPEP
ncbi:MAG: hypothetical protein AAF721_18520, partial [Myxococcota bacterium]